MRVLLITQISFLVLLLSGSLAHAQTSSVMTFSTSAYGSHKTETNATENSQTNFFGISIDAKNLKQQERFLNEVDRRETDSYQEAFETVTFMNTEQGTAIRKTQVQSIVEYDFADYEFTHSLDFEY